MPWKVSDIVNQRMNFVMRLEQGERMSDLCREFGISRKTGYKLAKRYKERGPLGLYDEPRIAKRLPHRTPDEVVDRILALKKTYPHWGSKKLKAELERTEPAVRFPARSTFDAVLKRHGLVETRKRRRKSTALRVPLCDTQAPNQLWCADFKGQFRTQDRRYCFPLTLSDHYSRFVLGCEGLEHTREPSARAVFEAVFDRYGLPEAIRTDNGSPFASTGLAGLSKLAVWWLQLGIVPERIEPGHPEQNGRHERMHRTLKEQTTRPAANNILQQQERFDHFVDEYNEQRPHEALNMLRPADVYRPSERPMPAALPQLDYPLHDDVRTVRRGGHICLWGRHSSFFLSSALVGHPVGLRQVDDHQWLLSFACLDLGHFNTTTRRFTALPKPQLHSPFSPKATA